MNCFGIVRESNERKLWKCHSRNPVKHHLIYIQFRVMIVLEPPRTCNRNFNLLASQGWWWSARTDWRSKGRSAMKLSNCCSRHQHNSFSDPSWRLSRRIVARLATAVFMSSILQPSRIKDRDSNKS